MLNRSAISGSLRLPGRADGISVIHVMHTTGSLALPLSFFSLSLARSLSLSLAADNCLSLGFAVFVVVVPVVVVSIVVSHSLFTPPPPAAALCKLK